MVFAGGACVEDDAGVLDSPVSTPSASDAFLLDGELLGGGGLSNGCTEGWSSITGSAVKVRRAVGYVVGAFIGGGGAALGPLLKVL